ncbi:MAG: VanZ family protein [Cryomorphaceae bacterium]|nr:VanZ family protein [Cryomorphaceae bacterium]
MKNHLSQPYRRLTRAYFIVLILIHLLPLGGAFQDVATNTFVVGKIRLDYFFHALIFIPAFPLVYYFFVTKSASESSFLPFLLVIILALSLETIQLLIPYRAFNFWDLIANFSGVLLGGLWVLMARLLFKH